MAVYRLYEDIKAVYMKRLKSRKKELKAFFESTEFDRIVKQLQKGGLINISDFDGGKSSVYGIIKDEFEKVFDAVFLKFGTTAHNNRFLKCEDGCTIEEDAIVYNGVIFHKIFRDGMTQTMYTRRATNSTSHFKDRVAVKYPEIVAALEFNDECETCKSFNTELFLNDWTLCRRLGSCPGISLSQDMRTDMLKLSKDIKEHNSR